METELNPFVATSSGDLAIARAKEWLRALSIGNAERFPGEEIEFRSPHTQMMLHSLARTAKPVMKIRTKHHRGTGDLWVMRVE